MNATIICEEEKSEFETRKCLFILMRNGEKAIIVGDGGGGHLLSWGNSWCQEIFVPLLLTMMMMMMMMLTSIHAQKTHCIFTDC